MVLDKGELPQTDGDDKDDGNEGVFYDCFSTQIKERQDMKDSETSLEDEYSIADEAGSDDNDENVFYDCLATASGEAVVDDCSSVPVVVEELVSTPTVEAVEAEGRTQDVATVADAARENNNTEALKEYYSAVVENNQTNCFVTNKAEGEDRDDFDMEKMKTDSQNTKLPTMKESTALENYILNEGIMQEVAVKCAKCMATDCKACIKTIRANPKEEEVLADMKKAMDKVKLEDNTFQFRVNYIVSEPLEEVFLSSKSNYMSAIVQAKKNYRQILSVPGGRQAINDMMDRGRDEGHFYFCSHREAEVILGAPHYFCKK